MASVLEQEEHRSTAALGDLILRRRHDILAEWELAVRQIPTAQPLARPALLDDVPRLLEAIALALSEPGGAHMDLAREIVELHALHRLDRGFDLVQVIAEYALLRQTVLQHLARESIGVDDAAAMVVLHRAIDDAIATSVSRFTEAQDRATRALDRLATASLESRNLDELLRRLLAVLLESMPAIDTAAIFLRDGELLRMHASVGLETEAAQSFTVPMGEGFAGKIAAEAKPLFLRRAADDPLVHSAGLREQGVRALYGVPLVEGAEVLGVAHIGSLTAYDFSDHDRRILEALAARVTTAIYQHILRQDAERRAAELAAVIESIPDGVSIGDLDGIRLANQTALDLLGLNGLEEARAGGHAALLSRLQSRDIRTGEPLSEEQSGMGRALRGETTVREIAITHPNGNQRMLRVASAPIQVDGKTDLAVSILTDITEAKRFEQERADLIERERAARARAQSAEATQRFLSEATALLSSSLDYRHTLDRLARLCVPVLGDCCVISFVGAGQDDALDLVAVAHCDPTREKAITDLFGRQPMTADVPAAGIANVIRTGRPEMRNAIDGAAPADGDMRLLRDMGATGYLTVPLSSRERVFGTLTVFSGGAERQYGQADLEVAEHLGRRAGLAIDNGRLLREAQEAIRLREQVLAIVSHDLRNPLGAVQMAGRLVAKRAHEMQDATLIRQTETISRSASRMEHLVNDLLDLAGIQAGRLKVQRRPEVAAQVIQEAVELHETVAQQKGIRIAADAGAPGISIDCDRERILQVFGNLIGNAVKFCDREDTVAVRATPEGQCMRFEVADTGPGIAPDELRRIFDAYWTAERAGKKGTGLGLFIAKGIVEAHRGRIWAESELGRGTTICFTIPIAAPTTS